MNTLPREMTQGIISTNVLKPIVIRPKRKLEEGNENPTPKHSMKPKRSTRKSLSERVTNNKTIHYVYLKIM